MKKLMLSLVLVSGFAHGAPEAVFPSVMNLGSHVQISVNNWEDRIVRCSGSINMTLEDGQYDYQTVMMTVFSRGYQTQTVYPRGMKSIRSMYHSIWCN